MRSDEEIHAALADEFSSYLGSIAKEIVAPVRETVAVQKDAISALIKSVDSARRDLEISLERNQEHLSSEAASLLAALGALANEMTITVGGVASESDKTRLELVSTIDTIGAAVKAGLDSQAISFAAMHSSLEASIGEFQRGAEPLITQTGRSLESRMMTVVEERVSQMEGRLLAGLSQGARSSIERLETGLARVMSFRNWLVGIVVLQSALIALLWIRTA